MKKVFSIVLVLVLLLSSFTMAFAATPTDVAGTDYETSVNTIISKGIVTGYPDGTFKLAGNVTRAEIAAMIVRALGQENAVSLIAKSNFPDMAGHWADKYVAVALEKKILKGYPDGTFKPNALVSYPEAITMVVRALGYVDGSNDLVGEWPSNYLSLANKLDITNNVDAVLSGSASRGAVATMLYNALFLDPVAIETEVAKTRRTHHSGDNVASRVDTRGNLKGDVIIAVNTAVNYGDDGELQKLPVGKLPSDDGDYSKFENLKQTIGIPLVKPEPKDLTFDNEKQVVGRDNPEITYQVGDEKEYGVANIAKYFKPEEMVNEPDLIPTTVKMEYAGKYCTVWQQVDPVYKKPDLNFGENNELAKKVADEFDTKIMTLVKNLYGDLYDVDNDGKFAIFLVDAVDLNNYGLQQNSLITGYCNPLVDTLPTSEGGIGMDVMVVDLWPTLFNNEGQQNQEDWTFAMQTVAHEMSHYSHFSYGMLHPEKTSGFPSWLTESLATFAETMYAGRGEYGDHSMYRYYNSDQFSLIANGRSNLEFHGAEEDYALVNMFAIYLYEQTKNLNGGGYTLLRSIVESNDEGYVAIENCLKDIGYPVTDFSDLLFNFRVAIIANEDSGVYSFNKNEAVQNYPIHFYKNADGMANAKTLAGGGAIVFKNVEGGFIPEGNNENVRFAGITLEK